LSKFGNLLLFGCSTAAAQQQMALNFELVVSDQHFQVIQNKRPWCWDAAYVTAGYKIDQRFSQ
jgi:hypothetical protein